MFSVNDVAVTLGKAKILNGVSFSIDQGEMVGIIGPNGSGKTTLFNAISGFAPLTHGEIFLGSEPIHELPSYARALAGLGRVFQNFGVFHEMTVAENLLVACESKGKKISTADIDALLAEVGLADKRHEKAASLSGGQKRLLEMCRTLAAGASMFLLDEPTAGVSPKMKGELIKYIERLKTQGKTVLVIEHDMNFISEFCSRILVIDHGRIVLDGDPGTIRSSDLLREIYFGK